jgi:hypothetical protein
VVKLVLLVPNKSTAVNMVYAVQFKWFVPLKDNVSLIKYRSLGMIDSLPTSKALEAMWLQGENPFRIRHLYDGRFAAFFYKIVAIFKLNSIFKTNLHYG